MSAWKHSRSDKNWLADVNRLLWIASPHFLQTKRWLASCVITLARVPASRSDTLELQNCGHLLFGMNFVQFYTVSQKNSPFLFLRLLVKCWPILNNIWYYCSWANLQTNDLYFSYNVQFVYEYYSIENKTYFACFQCSRFVLPSCQFPAVFFKSLSSLHSPQLLFGNSVSFFLLHNL